MPRIAPLTERAVPGAVRAPKRSALTGRAEVVVGGRALIAYAFEPLRQLRENLAGVPDARAEPLRPTPGASAPCG